ncbi:MAG: hypothetical protein ACMUIE_07230 [Thermoplasmatota archaeon]
MRNGKLLRTVLMFFLSAVIFFLAALLVTYTWGTGIGRTILYVIGFALIGVGLVVLVRGIRDLMKALRG